jgi:membrane fusion protein, multidrug efflux system
MSAQPPSDTAKQEPPLSTSRRKRVFQLLLLAVVIVVLVLIGHSLLVGRYHETTDNAYVNGNLVQVTPEINGTVVSIHADDTDLVVAGQPLIEFDRADSRVAQAEAEAQLAKTVREVRAMYASTDALRATLDMRSSELARARDDVARRESLAATGAVSAEELDHAHSTVTAAAATLAAAREQYESNRAQTEGTEVATHPLVLQSAGHLRETLLAAARGIVTAPVSGYVARRTVQLGQRVAAGTPLLMIVPLDAVWIDANLKESQLANIRIGQPAAVTADVYGSKVEFHGKVEGLSAGTGAVFSLLPAQNATGNWIKVVQRLPVRVTLDAEDVRKHPLRVGLSMRVDVDTTQRDGAVLAAAPPATTRFASLSQERLLADADARIADIIRANAGPASVLRAPGATRAAPAGAPPGPGR